MGCVWGIDGDEGRGFGDGEEADAEFAEGVLVDAGGRGGDGCVYGVADLGVGGEGGREVFGVAGGGEQSDAGDECGEGFLGDGGGVGGGGEGDEKGGMELPGSGFCFGLDGFADAFADGGGGGGGGEKLD